MRFTANEAYLIRTGAKTQHRVKPHRAARTKPGAEVTVEVPRRRKPEELYGFSSDIVTGGRRQRSEYVLEPEGRITITAKATQRIADMTPDDAKAEGFRSVEGFIRHWCDFDFDHAPTRARSVLDWTDRIAAILDTEVTVLVVEPATDERPLWLTPNGKPDRWDGDKDSDLGYTTRPGRAMLDAGPVLDDPAPEWADAAERRRVNARGARSIQERRRSLATRIRRAASPEQLDRIERALAEEEAA